MLPTRHLLLPIAKMMVSGTQFGSGLNGGTTEFAHMYVRAAMDAAGATGRSCAIVFLDCEKAFASVFRQLVFDAPKSDEAFHRSLVAGGFCSDTASEVLAGLKAEPVWAERDRFLGYAVRLMHELTWFSTEGLAGAVEVATPRCREYFFSQS